MSDDLIYGRKSPELLNYLLRRRSVSAKTLRDPGPDRAQIDIILKAAARVPDHGKMFPWFFIVFEGDARKKAGEVFRAAWKKREPAAAPAKLDLEAEKFLRAPVVIALVSRIRPGKHPAWEQILSAGAAAQNLILAANALGFGVNWLTEWVAFDDHVKAELSLDAQDNIAGFFYIGTPSEAPQERDRPDMAELITYWNGEKPNKGERYGHPDLGFAPVRIDLSNIK